MEVPTHKRTRVSLLQREKMLEFMLAHPDFARNRVAGVDAARKKNKLQAEFSAQLNSVALGASKSPDKWLKCWQDWRSDVKCKAAKIRHAQQQTGGGPGPTPLSSLEEALMAFIGHEAAEGIAVPDTLEIPESNFTENPEELVTVYVQEDTPMDENKKKNKKQEKLEECLDTQAAAMDQLSNSMNNLAAAINNLAAALNNMAFRNNDG